MGLIDYETGLAVYANFDILASLPLPITDLLPTESLHVVVSQHGIVEQIAASRATPTRVEQLKSAEISPVGSNPLLVGFACGSQQVSFLRSFLHLR